MSGELVFLFLFWSDAGQVTFEVIAWLLFHSEKGNPQYSMKVLSQPEKTPDLIALLPGRLTRREDTKLLRVTMRTSMFDHINFHSRGEKVCLWTTAKRTPHNTRH
jgi:hypothetical protein